MSVKFTEFKKGENWVSGEVDGGKYEFSAKLYDSGSVFGIEGGRVSKLGIWETYKNGGRYEFVAYDRGWDMHPSTEEEIRVYGAVMKFLEGAPKTRF